MDLYGLHSRDKTIGTAGSRPNRAITQHPKGPHKHVQRRQPTGGRTMNKQLTRTQHHNNAYILGIVLGLLGLMGIGHMYLGKIPQVNCQKVGT